MYGGFFVQVGKTMGKHLYAPAKFVMGLLSGETCVRITDGSVYQYLWYLWSGLNTSRQICVITLQEYVTSCDLSAFCYMLVIMLLPHTRIHWLIWHTYIRHQALLTTTIIIITHSYSFFFLAGNKICYIYW